jgi:hypothetical protein
MPSVTVTLGRGTSLLSFTRPEIVKELGGVKPEPVKLIPVTFGMLEDSVTEAEGGMKVAPASEGVTR